MPDSSKMSFNCTLQGDSRPDTKKCQDRILDIFSDVLQPNGNSLVPKSVERACLENAKVLSQVDKKFIAIVAGNTLAVIDQVVAFSRTFIEHFTLSSDASCVSVCAVCWCVFIFLFLFLFNTYKILIFSFCCPGMYSFVL